MDFKVKGGEKLRTTIAKKASETVIEAGDVVAINAGLIIKGVAASTKLAYCPNGAPAGTTDIEVTVGNGFTLIGTADANFAVTDKGAEVDLAGTTTPLIDLGASATDVFVVGISKTAGVAGSTKNVEVKINKYIF